MVNLFAVPFDSIKASETSEGVAYNIIDSKGNAYVQYYVSHKPYTLHDLLIENIQGAPRSMKVALEKELNDMLNEWKMVTVFSPDMAHKSSVLKNITFVDSAVRLQYNNKEKCVEKSDPIKSVTRGL